MRILIVDDEAPLAAAVSHYLEGLGHEVCVASDVPGALEQVHRAIPDVVLTDLLLEGGGAGQIFRSLTEGTDKPPGVIIMTGGCDEQLPDRLHHLPILHKPFRLHELAAALVQQCPKALVQEERQLCEATP